jgi:hypothetical protein
MQTCRADQTTSALRAKRMSAGEAIRSGTEIEDEHDLFAAPQVPTALHLGAARRAELSAPRRGIS